jgi:hypothetical protein
LPAGEVPAERNGWESPMMFVARYGDGSCGIAEASDEVSARELLQSEEAFFHEHDKIVSLRPLPRPFVSRWFFESKDSDELPEIDRLGGMLGHQVAEEIQEHEYPMILSAHSTCEQEEPLLDPKADMSDPLIYNMGQLDQMKKWEKNLKRRLRQAVELELERFKQ